MRGKKLKKHIFESSKRKELIEYLNVLGDKFSEENKVKHRNAAVIKFESLLNKIGLKFIPEKKVIVKYSTHFDNSKLYIIDFYIPKPDNLIFEIDGGYHKSPEQISYDKKRDGILKRKGIGKTIRITNETVLDPNFDIISIMPKYLKRRFRSLV